MLVRKLRHSQSIRIGPDVLVTCVRDLDGALVLAIDAPREWRISWPYRKLSESAEKPVAATFPPIMA